jgi:ParB/RepB/Spo0J family partition protein
MGEYETLQRFLANNFETELKNEPSESGSGEDPSDSEPPDNGNDVSDPGTLAQVRFGEHILTSGRARLAKRREELRRLAVSAKSEGPLGESRSVAITERLEMVPLDRIHDDPNFTNLRLFTKPDELQKLSDSMMQDGLKVPITLIAANPEADHFYVRAGFRRTLVARSLDWSAIPAIILPYNTPQVEEYWTNVVENSARSPLHPYETANAIRVMRDKFHITPTEFASRAGYSESYVYKLLRCLERLPETVLKAWREKEKIPFDTIHEWSKLEPSEAHKEMCRYAGHHPAIVKGWQPSMKRKPRVPLLMTTTKGLSRMQRLRIAITQAKDLDPKTRELSIRIVDFCSGAREDVPGIMKARAKIRTTKNRRQDELSMPEVGELPPTPPTEPDNDES